MGDRVGRSVRAALVGLADGRHQPVVLGAIVEAMAPFTMDNPDSLRWLIRRHPGKISTMIRDALVEAKLEDMAE